MAELPPRLPHFVRVVYTTGDVICGYRHLVKFGVLQQPLVTVVGNSCLELSAHARGTKSEAEILNF